MPISQPLPIEIQYFDNGLPVHHVHPGAMRRALGTVLTDPTLVLLSGAFRNSTLACSEDRDDNGVVVGIRLIVRHPAYIWPGQANEVIIQVDSSGALVLYVDYVLLAKGHPKGLATLMLWRMVRGCEAAAIDRIDLLAYGGRNTPDLDPATGERWGGYNAWPKMGFDGSVQQSETQLFPYFGCFPPSIAHQATVRDVLKLPGGSEWWRANGDSTYMSFKIGAHEESVQMLSAKAMAIS